MEEEKRGLTAPSPVKLYVVVLGRGWIRREMHYVLNEMGQTKGVEVYLEHLNRSFSEPIFANRNKISKRFLGTDCHFMMQIDQDVWPIGHNPAELVFANKDIIGCPAKVRQHHRAINWVAFIKHPESEGYAPVDFSRVDDTVDLLEVDAVGTGLILIRRNVVETLWKQGGGPFTVVLDDDGIPDFGTDFAFCRRAKEAGFKIYTTPQRVCEHVKEVGLVDIMAYDDCDNRDPIAGKYNIPWGEWAISQKDWEFLRNIIQRNSLRTVLEFGTGLSSLMLSETVEVVSYETDPEWAKLIEEKKIAGLNKLIIKIWNGKDIPAELLNGKRYDVVFVDGPPGLVTGGVGRSVSIPLATKLSDKVIIHDAQRDEEWGLQMKYLRGVFKLTARSGYYQACCHYWVRRQDEEEERLTS